MLHQAESGHTASPLGLADIAAALYFNILNVNPRHKKDPDRDRLYVSCGHTAPIWYAALARAGFFPIEELKSLRRLGSRLQGHLDRLATPGVELSSASLGQGVGVAAGAALAAKTDGAKWRTYVVASDGEHDEGSTWEAIMFAAHQKLTQLTIIVDRNNIQIDGPTETVMKLESLRDRYEAFGWHVLEIDGHNMTEIIDACAEAKAIVEQPVCIIAHTIPGKGVDFMEQDFRWHGVAPGGVETEKTPPKKEQLRAALKQLKVSD